MRMMKKVLGTVTVLALSVSLLAGCGSTAVSPVFFYCKHCGREHYKLCCFRNDIRSGG